MLDKKTGMVIFFTALSTAIAALIVSPLSVSLTFLLNDFLSRPILSIEHIEILPRKDNYDKLRADVNALKNEPYYNDLHLSGKISPYNELSVFSSSEKITDHQFTRLTAFLSKLKKTLLLEHKNTKNQVIEKPNLVPVKQLGNEIFQKNESSMLGFISKIDTLISECHSYDANLINNIDLKVHILNKGNTAGLIRSSGKLHILGTELTAQIINIPIPKKKSSYNAISVTVVDDLPDEKRTSSVGKIDKKSMIELWYTLYQENNHTNLKIREFIRNQKQVEFELSLYDHSNNTIRGVAQYITPINEVPAHEY